MGMLPSGTANDQGKSFGISSAESALDENIILFCAPTPKLLMLARLPRMTLMIKLFQPIIFLTQLAGGFQLQFLRLETKSLSL
jgi:hypothetical protein